MMPGYRTVLGHRAFPWRRADGRSGAGGAGTVRFRGAAQVVMAAESAPAARIVGVSARRDVSHLTDRPNR
jgi:hypothetical protein